MRVWIKRGQYQKVFLFLSALGLGATSLVAISLPKAGGHEYSIYRYTPATFWVGLFISVVFGVLTLIHVTIGEKDSERNLERFAVIILVFSQLIFILLPEFKGYWFFPRTGDILAHIGYAKTILKTGIPPSDIYPVFHILLSTLREVTGIHLLDLRTIISVVFTPLLFIGVFAGMRKIVDQRSAFLGVAVIGAPVLFGKFHITLQPAVISFMLFPILLLPLQAARRSERPRMGYHVILIVFGTFSVFFHPITAILFILFVGGFILAEEIWATRQSSTSISYRTPSTPAIITVILSAIWFIGNERGKGLVSSIFISDLAGQESFSRGGESVGGESVGSSTSGGIATAVTDYVTSANFTRLQLAEQFLQEYGYLSIYVGIGFLSVTWLLWDLYRSDGYPVIEIMFIVHFVIGGIVMASFMFYDLVVGSLLRASRYILLVGGLSSAFALSKMWTPGNGSRSRISTIFAFIIIFGIIAAIPASYLTAYPPNQHLTKSEDRGNKWILDHTPPEGNPHVFGNDPRQQSYVQGWHGSRNSPIYFHKHVKYSDLDSWPKFLGYRNNPSISQSFQSGLLVTKAYDTEFWKIFYQNQREQYTYYTKANVRHLRQDDSADHVYTNGEYNVWEVS